MSVPTRDFSREYTKSAYLECPWCGMRAMELVIRWEKDDRTVQCAVVGSAYVDQPDLAAPPGPHVCLVDGFDNRRIFGEDQ